MPKRLSDEQRNLVREIRECETLRELHALLADVQPATRRALVQATREQTNRIEVYNIHATRHQ